MNSMEADGARTLTEGLSRFPSAVTSSGAGAVPLAYWKSESFGFVVFLTGSLDSPDRFEPSIWTGQYECKTNEWIPVRPWYGGPWQGIQGPPGLPDNDDDIVLRCSGLLDSTPDEGSPALIVWGWCSAKVDQVSLVQGQAKVIIPIGHLGSWAIGSESNEPWTIEALDGTGNRLGLVSRYEWSD
jgi:hypothetical protein